MEIKKHPPPSQVHRVPTKPGVKPPFTPETTPNHTGTVCSGRLRRRISNYCHELQNCVGVPKDAPARSRTSCYNSMESGRRRSIHQVQVARAVQLAEGYQLHCGFFLWPNVPGLDPVIKGKIMQWQNRSASSSESTGKKPTAASPTTPTICIR